jgi:SAM-dependent methyltransferase
MAHYTQQQFVRWVKASFPNCFIGQRVLEVGSLDINGSVRCFFERCDYIGLDVGAGPGVDVVCGGQDFRAPDASFDVVCSFEAMEHNPYWRETFANMLRLTRPGGLVVMTCATFGRPEHGTARSNPEDSPLTGDIGWDYYRNLCRRDFEQAFDLQASFESLFFAHYYHGPDLFFFGFRRGAPAPAHARRVARVLRLRYGLRNLLGREALGTMCRVVLAGAR